MRLLLCFFLAFVTQSSFAQFNLTDFQPLQSLKGSWQSERKRGTLIESWSVVNDSTMHGYSYIKTTLDSIPEETVTLVLRAGKISFIADAAGQNAGKPVSFSLTGINKGSFTFENRLHDFPQRIIYEMINTETFKAAIYGPADGKEMEVRFDFKKLQSKK